MKKLYYRIPEKYRHWLYILILPVYMGLFFLEEHYINASSQYLVSYLPMDDTIPFCEYFVVPYVLWYPVLVSTGLYLLFCDGDGFRKYMQYIGIGFTTALIIMAIFPNGQNLRVTEFEHDNIFTRTIQWIYSADTNTNVCPSMHVIGTMAACFALYETPTLRSKWPAVLATVISIFVCMSTVFIKQHSILDIFVAIPYALAMFFFIYWVIPPKRPKRRAFAAELRKLR